MRLFRSQGTRERTLISFRKREKLRSLLAAPLGLFRGFGPRFRLNRFKSAWPAKNA